MVNKTLRFGRRIYAEDRAEDGAAPAGATPAGTALLMLIMA